VAGQFRSCNQGKVHLSDSRKEGHKIRKLFHEKLKVIEQKRIEALKAKEKELAEKKKRLLKKKI